MAKDKSSKRKSDELAESKIKTEEADMSVDSPEKKKSKKREGSEAEEGGNFDVPADALTTMAHPLAEDKLLKKVYKTVKKASKEKNHLKRGVKEVEKRLRKGDKGLVILAGDISPIDIISHVPGMCEELDIPYIWVTSKDALGEAANTKRSTSCVMVVPGAEKVRYSDDYEMVCGEAKKLLEELLLKVG